MHMRSAPALLLLVCGLLQAVESGSTRSAAAAAAAARTAPAVAAAAGPAAALPPNGAITIGTVQVVTTGPIARFSRFECTVAFQRMTGSAYYDPDPARGGVDLRAEFTAPDGSTQIIPGYYDGTIWRIRFAPNAEGAWSYVIKATDSSRTDSRTGGTFTCAGSSGHGWVRVAERWYKHADGTPFCPVGHNTGWQDNVEQPAFSTLTALAGSAPRLVSFWLCQPWATSGTRAPIEQQRLGDWIYNQTTCAYIDGVVDRAAAAGVYLLPSIWIHDQLRDATHSWNRDVDEDGIGDNPGNWDSAINPYKAINPDPISFFTLQDGDAPSEQWIRQQAFCRYLTARWGWSPAIAGWVGIVELNGTNGGENTPAQAGAWTQAMDGWFVAHDPYRSVGGHHPIAFSVTDWVIPPFLDPEDSLSQRAIDSYRWERDDAQIGPMLAEEVLSMAAAGGRKPVLVTEFGGNTTADPGQVPDRATQPLHLHNGIWASWIAGAAMPALQWCDVSPFPMLNPEMSGHLSSLAGFIGRQGWISDETQAVIPVADTGRGDVQAWCRQVGDRGVAWMLRTNGTDDLAGAAISVSATNGRYARWWYDSWTGDESTPVTVDVTDTTLRLTAPSSPNPDVAVSWQRYPEASGLSTTAAQGSRLRLTLAPTAPKVLVTSLPARGRIWQALDATTAGAQITSVPAVVSDPGHRIFFDAPAELGALSFSYAIEEGRLQGGADIAIQVVEYVPSPDVDADGNSIEHVPAHGCGAGAIGGVAGLGLIALLGLRRRRR